MPSKEFRKEQIGKIGTGITRVNTEQFNEIQSENEKEAILAVAVEIETQIVEEYIQARESNTRNAYHKNLDKRKAFYERLIKRFYSDTENTASIISQLPEISHLELKEANKIRNIETRLIVLNLYMDHELKLLGVEREIARHIEEKDTYKKEGKEGLWIKRQNILEKSRIRILRRLRIQEQQQQQQQSSIGNAPAIPPVKEDGDHSSDENDEVLEEIDLGEHERLGNMESFLEEVQGNLNANNPITSLVLGEGLNPLPNLMEYVKTQVISAGENHPEVDDEIVGATIQYVHDLLYGSRPDDFRGLTNVEIDEIDRIGYHEVIFQFTIDGAVLVGDELDTRYPVEMILHYGRMSFMGEIENLIKERLVDGIEAANNLTLLDEIEGSLEEKLTQEEDRNELRLLIEKKRKEIEAILALGNLAEIDLDDLVGQLAEQVKVETGIPLPSGNPSDPAQPTAEQLNNLRKINQAIQQKVAQVATQQNLTAPQAQQLAQQLQNNLLAQYNLDAVWDVLNNQLEEVARTNRNFQFLSDVGNTLTTLNDAGSTLVAVAETLEAGVESATSFYETAGQALFGVSMGMNVILGLVEFAKSLRDDALNDTLIAAGVTPSLLDSEKGKLKALRKGAEKFLDKAVPAIKTFKKLDFIKREMGLFESQVDNLEKQQEQFREALVKANDSGQPAEVVAKIRKGLQRTEIDLIIAHKMLEKHSHTFLNYMGAIRDVATTAGDLCFLLGFFIPPAATIGAAIVGVKVTNQTLIAGAKMIRQRAKGNEDLYNADVAEYLDMEQRLGSEFFRKAMLPGRRFRFDYLSRFSKTSRHKLVARLVYSLELSHTSMSVNLNSLVAELVETAQLQGDFEAYKDDIQGLIALNNSTQEQTAEMAFDIFHHSKGLEGAYTRTVLGLGATGIPSLENTDIRNFTKEQFLEAVKAFKLLTIPTIQHGNQTVPIDQVLNKFAEEVFTVIYQYFDMY